MTVTRRRIWQVLLAAMLGLAACGSPASAPTTGLPATTPQTTSNVVFTTQPPATVADPPATTQPTTTTAPEPPLATTTTTAPPSTVRIVLVGDVMLGRGVKRTVADDPDAVFAGVRDVLTAADIAAANLESPLTTRRHIAINPNALQAPPASADALAAGGFDVLALANNHATDSGRSTVLDSIAALDAVGLASVGAGPDQATAFTPLVLETDGVRVALLSFDVTLAAWPSTPTKAGVSHWDPRLVEPAVRSAAGLADVVVVAVHGGVEYRTAADSTMAGVAEQLAEWGADVVWGHGPHVVQPVYVVGSPDGRPVVVATSLGNFLFDMRAAGTQEGIILEVEVGLEGVVAYRLGRAEHPDRVVRFLGWMAAADADGWVTVGG